ncbi:hypothetical protein TcCL_Unassigned03383 [Trypanosoma cruzi]|nr:hypothetical protein TcCL_Unassigned03383 [Trypanosoma cruzi]
MQALRVCVQVPCNNVTANMLRLGDPHIAVVLTHSPGTAHTDALSGRSGASFERCREQDVLTQPRRAWSVTMAQSAVAGGIFTSRSQQREGESCSCCWRRCCPLWPPMPIIVCPLIMGGMPPLVTSSAGIPQHQRNTHHFACFGCGCGVVNAAGIILPDSFSLPCDK